MTENYFTQEDIEENKNLALLSYLAFLFIVPFSKGKNSPYAMFHAKQGRVLFVFEVAVFLADKLNTMFLQNMVPLSVNVALGLVLSVSTLLCATFTVFGIIKVVKGEAKVLPLIGKFAK